MVRIRFLQVAENVNRLLFERINQQLGIAVADIEIVICELPKHNWGIRGIPGNELVLNYVVEA